MRTYQLWFPACSLKEAFLHQMNFFIFLNFFSRYHPQSKSQLFYTTGLCVDDVHIFHQPNKRKCFSLYGSFDPKSGVCTLNRSFNLNAAVHSNSRRHFDIKKTDQNLTTASMRTSNHRTIRLSSRISFSAASPWIEDINVILISAWFLSRVKRRSVNWSRCITTVS